MKREKVSFNEAGYNRELANLEQLAKPITKARTEAAKVIGKLPTTLTGKEEVEEALKLPDYPQAPQHTAAELLGLSSELRAYRAALEKVKEAAKFTLSGNEVVPTAEAIEQVKEANSLYLSGEKLEAFKLLKKASNEINKVDKPIYRQAIQFDHTGQAAPNIQQLIMMR